jgi:hypothetical protein
MLSMAQSNCTGFLPGSKSQIGVIYCIPRLIYSSILFTFEQIQSGVAKSLTQSLSWAAWHFADKGIRWTAAFCGRWRFRCRTDAWRYCRLPRSGPAARD